MHYAHFSPHARIGQLTDEEARHEATLDAQRRAEERQRQENERAERVRRALEGQLRVVLPRSIPSERERRYDPVIRTPTTPDPTSPPPVMSPAPTAPTTPAGNGTDVSLPSPVVSAATRTIGQALFDIALVTSPAWGALLLSRLLR